MPCSLPVRQRLATFCDGRGRTTPDIESIVVHLGQLGRGAVETPVGLCDARVVVESIFVPRYERANAEATSSNVRVPVHSARHSNLSGGNGWK